MGDRMMVIMCFCSCAQDMPQQKKRVLWFFQALFEREGLLVVEKYLGVVSR